MYRVLISHECTFIAMHLAYRCPRGVSLYVALQRIFSERSGEGGTGES